MGSGVVIGMKDKYGDSDAARQNDDACGWLGRGEVGEEADDGLDAAVEVGEVEFLVGGVEVVVGQAEAHEDGGRAERADEVADDGDGAAAADEDGVFAFFIDPAGAGGYDVGILGALPI